MADEDMYYKPKELRKCSKFEAYVWEQILRENAKVGRKLDLDQG